MVDVSKSTNVPGTSLDATGMPLVHLLGAQKFEFSKKGPIPVHLFHLHLARTFSKSTKSREQR